MKSKTLVAAVAAVALTIAASPAANAAAKHTKHHKARHTHAKHHKATRFTGKQACAVKNGANWSLVGGASCNTHPATASTHSAWEASYIIDFSAKTVTKVTGPAAPAFSGSTAAEFMTYLNANFASKGWMYVGNKTGNGKYVYLLVKCASGKKTLWDIQGTCAA